MDLKICFGTLLVSDPETGEINWDCPCLGGMAHGVCGEQFKIAFGCFVYSEAEPKGVECIEAFKSMQECFKAHPDVYGLYRFFFTLPIFPNPRRRAKHWKERGIDTSDVPLFHLLR